MKRRILAALFVVPMSIAFAQQDEGKWSGEGRASRDIARKEYGGAMTGGVYGNPGSQATGFITTRGSLSTQSYDALKSNKAKWSGEGRIRDLTRKGFGG